jgi:hypothetical protein
MFLPYSCIDVNEHCCNEKDEACVNVFKYKDFFSSKTVDSICEIFTEGDGNFTESYPEYKYNNPVEEELCGNGTYFCPLVIHCIPMNHSCDPDTVYQKDVEEVFEEECGQNETFCPLYMHCIPSDQACSFRALFDWYDAGDKSVDPFSQPCPGNQTFCPKTFRCNDSCEREDMMGNKSCNATEGDTCGEGWECGENATECRKKMNAGNFVNVTDSTASGKYINKPKCKVKY